MRNSGEIVFIHEYFELIWDVGKGKKMLQNEKYLLNLSRFNNKGV
jgi:hypothetical protein